MTESEFAPIMAYLSSAVGKPVAQNQAEVYWDLLGDLPSEVLATAARQVLLESAYPTLPTVGTLRQRCLALMQPPGLQAMEAWELVMRAVNRYGFAGETRALATLPDVAARAARALGWQSLCDATVEQIPTVRAQFRDAYNSLAQRQEREALPPARYQRQAAKVLGDIAECLRLEGK